MAKPITAEDTAAFREYCREQLAAEEDGVVYFTIESYGPFQEETEDGWSLWDFCPDGDDSHDILELFESVSDEFEIEEEGHGSFFISSTNASEEDSDEG